MSSRNSLSSERRNKTILTIVFSVICSKPLCHLHVQWLRGLTERHKEIKVKPKQSRDCVTLLLVPHGLCLPLLESVILKHGC